MPWHGDLRAETGDLIDRRTGGQALIIKGCIPALWA